MSVQMKAPNQGILSLPIKDRTTLFQWYMPFVKNGGLFIPTNRQYDLGDEVFILISLMDEPERLPVAGKIIWITPPGAEGNRPSGIGIQFSAQDGGMVRNKIETCLAGMQSANLRTHTL